MRNAVSFKESSSRTLVIVGAKLPKCPLCRSRLCWTHRDIAEDSTAFWLISDEQGMVKVGDVVPDRYSNKKRARLNASRVVYQRVRCLKDQSEFFSCKRPRVGGWRTIGAV